MAVCFKVNAKFGACNRSSKLAQRALLKTTEARQVSHITDKKQADFLRSL